MQTINRPAARVLGLAAALLLVSGCAAMMMGGDSGTYRPPADECSDGQKDGRPCRGN